MNFDIIIIGAGIIGLTTAYHLKQRNQHLKIAIIDKEDKVASHASGRNSGVLHAGFSYTPGSFKANFARKGNLALKEYCRIHNIPICNNGKLVVARDETELTVLYELDKKAKLNGVDVSLINEKEVAAIEPKAQTFQLALYSPNTATTDPSLVCNQLTRDLQAKGIYFFFNTPYIKRIGNNGILGGNKQLFAERFINAAGMYADKIARDFGLGQKYCVLPLKGRFMETNDPRVDLKTNIYPIPNPNRPFLGVHFVVAPFGKVKIGPTATPVFWRENYGGLKRFIFSEFYDILSKQLRLLKENGADFRSLAYEELLKLNPMHLKGQAAGLVTNLDLGLFKKWGKVGIRAQLLNIEDLSFVQDFIVENGENSVHILNTVSPGFTCSFPFSEWVVDNYL